MFIEGKFVELNKYITSLNSSRYRGNNVKQEMTNLVYWQAVGKPKFKTPAVFKFVWFVKDRRKDPDGIAFAKKYVLDGLQKAGIITGDGFREVKGFIDEFIVSDKEGVEVVAVY